MADSRLAFVLRQAAQRIETDGLNKGSYFEDFDAANEPPGMVQVRAREILALGQRPKVDVFGAIYLEAANDMEIIGVFEAIAIHGFGFDSYGLTAARHMVDWADDEALTGDDVAALLRRTADAVEVAA